MAKCTYDDCDGDRLPGRTICQIHGDYETAIEPGDRIRRRARRCKRILDQLMAALISAGIGSEALGEVYTRAEEFIGSDDV